MLCFSFIFVCKYGLNSYLYYISYFASKVFVCSGNKPNLLSRQPVARTPTSDLITSPLATFSDKVAGSVNAAYVLNSVFFSQIQFFCIAVHNVVLNVANIRFPV